MLKPPAFHDIARIIGRDIDETEARLYEYYTNTDKAFFNYRRALKLSRFVFGREVGLSQILESCKAEKTEQGRKSNSDVLRLLWGASDSRSVRTYELAPKFLAIRKDLRIRVAPPFYFVEGDKAYVFWLQPRKNYALDHAALGFLASMIKATFLVDDFHDVGLEVCDMSSPSPKQDREITSYHLESFNIMSEGEATHKLQLFALAYDRLVARGVERSKRAQRSQQLPGPDLFSE